MYYVLRIFYNGQFQYLTQRDHNTMLMATTIEDALCYPCMENALFSRLYIYTNFGIEFDVVKVGKTIG